MALPVVAATLLAAILVLLLPRKYAVAPILVATFLTPFGQQLLVGGFHFFVIRIIILAGALRLLGVKLLGGEPLFPGGLNTLDKAFCLWAFVRGIAFILLFKETAAVVSQVGLWLDAFGVYFIFRHLLQNKEDILRATKVFAFVAAVLAVCMSYEFLTRVNVFSYIGGVAIVPWIRNGNVRAQGVFGNSITAGSFGAALLPLFFWLWKSGKAKMWGVIGLVAATLVALTSVSSTPITGYLAGILALCLWPVRKQMRPIRWGILFGVLGLALVMKAPIWFLITRINIAGGQSWDRAHLIDETVHHFSSWWLLGTSESASWGDFTWDQCNQFVNEALQGGLITLVLFIVILRRAFGMIGQARKGTQGEREEWFFWCLGAALFAHVIIFLGIDYFDQTRTLWFIFLAMISSAAIPILATETIREPGTAAFRSLGSPRLAPSANSRIPSPVGVQGQPGNLRTAPRQTLVSDTGTNPANKAKGFPHGLRFHKG